MFSPCCVRKALDKLKMLDFSIRHLKDLIGD